MAFTATQIPNIDGRVYPPEIAGDLYPDGIPVYPEKELTRLIREHGVDTVVFAYSDMSHVHVMHKASEALSAGASFMLLGPNDTMLKSSKPVIAVCAARTGSGKSQTSRRVLEAVSRMGKKAVVVRHPMPYGDLLAERVQRFSKLGDLEAANCTVEEREEYAPHLERGAVVYAGVDYQEILRMAEKEADVIIWDGGNNDFPFFKPDLLIVVVDPHRPGHEIWYHPGETNVRMADVILVNKVDTARPDNIKKVEDNVRSLNPKATIIECKSKILVKDPESINGKSVLVVEDGPSITHGELPYGAAYYAARMNGAREIVDPTPFAVGAIREAMQKYSHLSVAVPAVGYSASQISDLQETINRVPADVVVSATPVRLSAIAKLNKPVVQVRYELEETGRPTIEDIVRRVLKE